MSKNLLFLWCSTKHKAVPGAVVVCASTECVQYAPCTASPHEDRPLKHEAEGLPILVIHVI